MAKQKKGCGCLIGIFLIFFILPLGIAFLNRDYIEQSHEQSQQVDLEEFDKRTWNDFKEIYKAYNSAIIAMNNIDNPNAYNIIRDMKQYFMNKSTELNYGKTDEQDQYLSTLNSICISSQQMCEYALKFMDNGKQSTLQNMKDEMARTKQGVEIFAGNRAILLKKIGYTEEEIKKMANDLDNELESVE